MKAKINNVVELSSLDKIDTRRFLFNQTFIVGGFFDGLLVNFSFIVSK